MGNPKRTSSKKEWSKLTEENVQKSVASSVDVNKRIVEQVEHCIFNL